jgi:hypothetical protein
VVKEILEEHQPQMGLEEKHRPHMQLFNTEEKDKKRQEPLHESRSADAELQAKQESLVDSTTY